MKQNPFKYGELSTGENFCNRLPEQKRLHAAFRDGQSIVLISPRRWGKSSLVNQALHTYKGRVIAIKIDCFGIKSSEEFYVVFLKAVLLATSSKVQQVADSVKQFVRTWIPYIKYAVGEGEEIRISLDVPSSKVGVDEILDLAQKIAHQRKVRIVCCIDEFQKVSEWAGGASLLEKLRSHWQKHKEVSYCLYGSKRHLMASMFADSSQPFYRFGETLFLEKIGKDEWVRFLTSEFQRTGKSIEPAVAMDLVERVQSHSYFVQYLGRICWNNTPRKVTAQILQASYEEFMNDHVALFQQICKGMTLYQVNYLRAVVAGESQFTSQRVLTGYGIGSQGNVKRIMDTLQDSEVLDFATGGPVFCDPFFQPLFQKYFVENR
ncbi:MAG: AAA family ATPase [Cytophagales bacterium]|nr:AAA family ATPase [Cytophagales bacterium]